MPLSFHAWKEKKMLIVHSVAIIKGKNVLGEQIGEQIFQIT